MRVLVDTHAFLWFLAEDPRLSGKAGSVMEDRGTTVVLSVASLWEIGIKVSIGKLELGRSFESFIEEFVLKGLVEIVGIEIRHIKRLVGLPMHHRDPFDRLLIAQAGAEEIPILTDDRRFRSYGVEVIW